jgi:hypothetical protein
MKRRIENWLKGGYFLRAVVIFVNLCLMLFAGGTERKQQPGTSG